MYLLLAFLAFLGAVECQSFSVNIVGGSDADIQYFPYLVSIRKYNYIHVCGGSILTDKHILTAAHCVLPFRSNPLSLSIQYGLTSISKDTKNSIQVDKIVYHSDYPNKLPYENDIAVITLKSCIPMTNATQIMLPTDPAPQGETATVAGWGITATGGKTVKDLLQVDLEIFSDRKCKSQLSPLTDPRYHICAEAPGGGRSECQGDSGGPLVIDGVQYGIVSWSAKPCGQFPGVFTNVYKYIDWIYQQVDE